MESTEGLYEIETSGSGGSSRKRERNDMSTATAGTEVRTLAVYDRISDPMAAIATLGRDIAHSQMFGCSNEEQGRVLAMTCFAKRMDPLALAESYHLIQGKLSMRADRMLAGLHERGGSHRIIQRNPEAAAIEITIHGDTQQFSLTWHDAQQEPFVYGKEKNGKRQLKDNWATPRSRMQMLWARVVSDGVRAMCPEVVCGAYVPEEIDDLDVAADEPRSVVVEAEFTHQAEAAGAFGAAGGTAKEAPKESTVYATGAQVQRVLDLYVKLQVPVEAQEAALKKRSCNSLRSLTAQQADEMIGKLESLAAKIAADRVVADQSKANPAAVKATDNSPAGQTQIDEAKNLMRQVSQNGQPDIADRVKAKLMQSGLSKLADLSMAEIDRLNKALSIRNLEAFFTTSLQGHASQASQAKN